MSQGRTWLWRIGKLLIALVIVIAVGWRFSQDLRDDSVDWERLQLRPEWLAAAALIYLVGLAFSGAFWYRLLWRFGDQPRIWPAVRAYYVGHLGKYVPGKAVALLLRASLIRGPQVRLGVAILSAFYEVLTTMAAGALLAAVVFTVQPPQIAGLEWNPVFIGLLLLALAGIPIMPGLFNRVVGRLARRFQSVEAFRLPQLALGTLLQGLILASCGWLLLGLSMWCTTNAVAPEFVPLTWETTPQLVAATSLAYVAGFLALVVPGGIGVREFLLKPLLVPIVHSDAVAIAAVVLLRIIWTAAEVVIAGVVYFMPVKSAKPAVEPAALKPSDNSC